LQKEPGLVFLHHKSKGNTGPDAFARVNLGRAKIKGKNSKSYAVPEGALLTRNQTNRAREGGEHERVKLD